MNETTEKAIMWRGSASDLATDIASELTSDQVRRVICELQDKLRCASVDDVGGRCSRPRSHLGAHESEGASVQWTDATPQRKRSR